MQRWPKDRADDRGGWRYIDDGGTNSEYDSDLSITGWQLMFLRSARNAGFNVPKQPIDDAVGYIRRCYSQQHDVFEYVTGDDDDRSRAMAGAGILALAMRASIGATKLKDRPSGFLITISTATTSSFLWDRIATIDTTTPSLPAARGCISLVADIGRSFFRPPWPRFWQTDFRTVPGPPIATGTTGNLAVRTRRRL